MLEAGVLAGDLAQLSVADTLRVEVTALAVHQGHGQGQQQPETHVYPTRNSVIHKESLGEVPTGRFIFTDHQQQLLTSDLHSHALARTHVYSVSSASRACNIVLYSHSFLTTTLCLPTIQQVVSTDVLVTMAVCYCDYGSVVYNITLIPTVFTDFNMFLCVY